MDAYILYPRNEQIERIYDENFFYQRQPVLHRSLDKALDYLDSDKFLIIHIEFINKKEILDAIYCAFMGNVNTRFKINILNVITVDKVNGKNK